jgi:hypothetical protein
MKQVETSQIFDVKISLENASQFDRRKKVKAESETPAVAEFNIASVPDVIVFQMAGLLN